MSLKLSNKKARRYNARQLKKWQVRQANECVVAIDLDGIQSVKDFYQRLAAKVDLPSYTAINLDALHDVLLGDVVESIMFRWKTVVEDVASDPQALQGLKRVLDDLPQARADISISYKSCSN